MIQKLKITITKTSVGTAEYVQVMSDDTVSVNVVLVAGEIEVIDARPSEKRKTVSGTKGGRA